MRRALLGLFVAALLAGLAPAGLTLAAEAFPAKPVQVIVPFDAGGGSDFIFRTAANLITKYWGKQPLVVVNKPGAAGTIGTTTVAKSKPDGYTLLCAQPGPLLLNPLQQKVEYKPEDFDVPIQLVSTPQMLAVGMEAPWKTAKDLGDYAKANPEKVKVGIVGYGNLLHLMTLRFQQLTGAKFTLVPFTGSAPARKELMSGNIDAMMITSEAASFVKSGTMKALAFTGEKRFPGLDVPTFAEVGYTEMKGGDSWVGVALPKGAPKPAVDKLVEAFGKVAADPDFVAACDKMFMPVVFLGPQEMTKKIAEFQAFFPSFVKQMGIEKKD